MLVNHYLLEMITILQCHLPTERDPDLAASKLTSRIKPNEPVSKLMGFEASSGAPRNTSDVLSEAARSASPNVNMETLSQRASIG